MCATRQVCGRRHYFHVAPFRTHLLLFLKQKRYEFNIVDLIGYLDIEEKVRAKMLMARRLKGVLASMWCKRKVVTPPTTTRKTSKRSNKKTTTTFKKGNC